MRIITERDIEELNISSQEYIEWIDEALRAKYNSILPAKISIKQEGHKFFNVMPCIMPTLCAAGVKVVTRYPERNPSLKSELLLYNNESGELQAIFDADYITTWRTAAVAVHSLKMFARANYKNIAFIGLGVIGQAALRVYIDTLEDKNVEIRLFNYKNRAEKIAEQYASKQLRFKLYDSYEKMVEDCDAIISAVTYADEDFCSEKLYKKGCLIIPIHTRGFLECDLTFDKIFGDDTDHVSGFKYFNRFKMFNETAKVLSGECKGRESEEERILVYNIGIALHDILFANKILKRLEHRC